MKLQLQVDVLGSQDGILGLFSGVRDSPFGNRGFLDAVQHSFAGNLL